MTITLKNAILDDDRTIACLDKGYATLVDWMGSDINIVRAARVSYGAQWRAGDDEGSDARLIRSLIARGHTSPFEAVTVTFNIKAPIFVFRQWHRHRTQSYNEVSTRYKELPNEFYIPKPEDVGMQDAIEKQARNKDIEFPDQVARQHRISEIADYIETCGDAFNTYRDLLAAGWPRELARMCLPVSTYSEMFATANLLNWFRFMELRLDSHAQYEIRVYAEAIAKLMQEVVPVSMEAWLEKRTLLGQG